jgi:hypothetical protein
VRQRRPLWVSRADRFSIRFSGYVVALWALLELLGYSEPQDSLILWCTSLNKSHFDRIFATVSKTECEWLWIDTLALQLDGCDVPSQALC